MRVLVVGSGGVGGYIAGMLLKCQKNVDLLTTPNSAEIIRQKGLKIIDVDSDFTVYPQTEIKGIYDIVFITVKYYSLKDVLKKISPHVNSETLVIPLLNGVAHFDLLKQLSAKVLKACIYILSNKKTAGVIHKKTPLFYMCIEDNGKIKNLFENCPLKVKYSKTIMHDIWKKYLFISTFATLQSFYMKPTGWIMEHKRDEVEKFIEEVVKIASGYGVDIKNEKEKVIKQALSIPYESKMSMQIDFENSQKTELETITGFLAQKSKFINSYYRKMNEQ